MKNLIEACIYFSNLAYLDNNYIKSKDYIKCFSDQKSFEFIEKNNLNPVINYKLDIGLPSILYCIYDNKLFISFPGINSNADKINCLNFNSQYSKDFKCNIHKGFLYIFNRLRSEIELIMDVNKELKMEIIFTGHSLGGAIAKLSSVYFKVNKDINSKCITFACPLIGGKCFAKIFNESVKNAFTLCCQKDFLIKIPFYRYCKEENKYMIDDNNIVSYKDLCSSYIYNFLTGNVESHRLEYYLKYLISIEFEVPSE